MAKNDQSLVRAVRVYEILLRVYPRTHRHEYGALMRQLFRDQWQDAMREGKGGVPVCLGLATLGDLIRSAFCEHIALQSQLMKNISWKKLSWILFAVAVVSGMASCPLSLDPPKGLVLAYFSGLIMAVRAVVEWKRPITELLASLTTGAILAIIYALVLPVWAKVHLPIMVGFVAIPLLLNGFIPLVRAGMRLMTRHS